MDANGTRHHALLGADDWSAAELTADPAGSVSYDRAREELTLRPVDFRFAAGLGDRPPALRDRRGAAADRFGTIYWIAESEDQVMAQSAGSGVTSVFWAPGIGDASARVRKRLRPAGQFGPVTAGAAAGPPRCRLAGLAVTDDHFLVVGSLHPVGLLVFDLHAPSAPRHELWPAAVALTPFDLCGRTGGGVFLLDRERRQLWELDRRLQVVSRSDPAGGGVQPDFGPVDGRDRTVEPVAGATVDVGDALQLDGDPIAVERAPGGRILVLDRGADAGVSTIRLVTPGVADDIRAPLQDSTPLGPAYQVVAHDMALVPGEPFGTLYAADRAGNQAYAFHLELTGTTLSARPEHAYLPMQQYGGKGLITGPDGPLVDFGSRWIRLVRQCRPQFEPAGQVRPDVFDAGLPGTVWHRLLLDAAIPPETTVRIESRAADERLDLGVLPWRLEPPVIYQRRTGAELPYIGADPGFGTWEVLVQAATGRYLELRLTLTGDGRRTPRIRALRAYYPRFSYPEHYLPQVYREDLTSASFLDRYLANAEGITTGLEDRIVAAQTMFDPRSCPPDALDWLVGWFGVTVDPSWDEDRRRLFIRHAMRFFALRGTVAGLQCALRLALDACVDERVFDEAGSGGPFRIVERFRTRQVLPAQLGDPTADVGPRIIPLSARWDPIQGGDVLVQRWRETVGDEDAEFPLAAGGPAWRDFWRRVIGGEPPPDGEPAGWISFLAGRYRRIDALDTAYGLAGAGRHTSIAEVGYPTRVPADGAALRDWFHFVTVVLPAARNAHRFTVLLAVPGANLDIALAEERKAIVRRIVELQKPAHTTFDVKFFWSAFRIGEARLGEDTLVGLGSRDPQFHRALVLGQEYAGESSLAGGLAPVPNRVGRDPLNR